MSYKPQDPLATGPIQTIPSRPKTSLPGRPARTFQFRTDQPTVARYVARVVILCHMDFEHAVEKMEARLEPEAIKTIAARLETDPLVRSEIEKQLKAKGLDEDAKAIFVEETWNRYWSGSKDEKKDATRVLAKAFIAEKADNDKPVNLPIQGFDQGVAVMLGKTEPPENFDSPPGTEDPDDTLDL